jgi:hypothetical protein
MGSIYKKSIALPIIAVILLLFPVACTVTGGGTAGQPGDIADADANKGMTSDYEGGTDPIGKNGNASTCVQLGERLSPYTFSYTSDGDIISKEQATDLAVDMLISEIPTLGKTLLSYDDYFGEDYYGYRVNSWYMNDSGAYIEERVACIRPDGGGLIDGMFYNVEYYEYINDEFGIRMPVKLAVAVFVSKKVIIKDYIFNDEAVGEFNMYAEDA